MVVEAGLVVVAGVVVAGLELVMVVVVAGLELVTVVVVAGLVVVVVVVVVGLEVEVLPEIGVMDEDCTLLFTGFVTAGTSVRAPVTTLLVPLLLNELPVPVVPATRLS